MRFIPIAAVLAALAALPAPASAQPAPSQPAQASTSIPAGHVRADELMDRDVYSTDGVEIGEVEDLIIDPAAGRIAMVIIEVENRLGLTQKHVSVPMDRLRVAPGERRVTINMASNEIRSLPGVNY
ncbi:PRC-barrel domain-containing protein [Muricoccus pecuniae]|uniref:Sporulation protein YlmC with PRC-barrel domain n=1 Tax=Muricoccus pecuniae TaxID=693023 RepID=A0A840YLG4_9PROT|nr:PRC-barrel domain-containing protein [Roseomonas pecuniae]MBB5695204.1 sporulation protein YlmC with PRC-barrel domain [Roseomonas pecuniae]